MRFQRWVALVLAVSLGLAVAHDAAQAAPLDPRELTARKEFAAGRYSQSVELFAELFAETGDPVFLRNIARCYQKLQRPEESISNFQEYLSKANVSPAERAEIAAYVRQMEDLKRQRALSGQTGSPGGVAAPPAPAPSEQPANPFGARGPVAVPPAAAPSPAGSSSTGAASANSEPYRMREGEADSARRWRITGIVSAIGGVALIGTGIGFGLAAKKAGEDVSFQVDSKRESAGQRYEMLQWISYGIGAAALATGGLMYMFGSGRAEHSSGVHVAASAWPPQLGMEARF